MLQHARLPGFRAGNVVTPLFIDFVQRSLRFHCVYLFQWLSGGFALPKDRHVCSLPFNSAVSIRTNARQSLRGEY